MTDIIPHYNVVNSVYYSHSPSYYSIKNGGSHYSIVQFKCDEKDFDKVSKYVTSLYATNDIASVNLFGKYIEKRFYKNKILFSLIVFYKSNITISQETNEKEEEIYDMVSPESYVQPKAELRCKMAKAFELYPNFFNAPKTSMNFTATFSEKTETVSEEINETETLVEFTEDTVFFNK